MPEKLEKGDWARVLSSETTRLGRLAGRVVQGRASRIRHTCSCMFRSAMAVVAISRVLS